MEALIKHKNPLIEKNISICYDNAEFNLHIDKLNRISWCFKDNSNIEIKDTNPVFIKQLTKDKFIIEWINSNKIVINKHIDLENNSIICNWYSGSGSYTFSGKIKNLL
nr:hypothetical protein [uncultured Flavobacterium sp.]